MTALLSLPASLLAPLGAPLLTPLGAVVERGPLRWAAAPAAWALVLLLAAVALSIRAIYRREEGRIPGVVRGLLTFLRLAAVVLVLGALFRPFREEVQKTQDQARIVVLIDTSASMSTKDRHRPDDEKRLLAAAYPDDGAERRPSEFTLSRLDALKRVLAPEGDAVLSKLASRFVVQTFSFDEELRSLDPPEAPADEPDGADAKEAQKKRIAEVGKRIRALEAAGARTDIGTALLGVARDALGRDDRRLAGVVLITDGKDNAESQRPLDAVMGLGKAREDLRVTAVALGDPRLAKNLKVDHISAKEIVLKQELVTFLIELRQTGFDGVDGVDVSLEIDQTADKEGKALPKPRRYQPSESERDPQARLSAKVRLATSDKPTPVALRQQFLEPGTYRVRVKAKLPKAQQGDDAVAEDDEKTVMVRVVDQTLRVLLADGTLRYEAHFLKNLLVRESRHAGDPRQIDAHVWIQSFDKDVEQPYSRDLKKPLRAFPSTKAEIYSYDVIILGDVDWRTLLGDRAPEEASRRLLQTIKEFVADGGGLAIIAGENHVPDELSTTPLGDVLPVIARPSDRENVPRGIGFRIAPTDVGLVHPILSVLQETPEAVARTWAQREGWVWYWLYRATGGLKPGAFALARVAGVSDLAFRDDRQELLPVFVGMPFGKGRVFFSAIDQIHRTRREYGDVYYGSIWDETIRWLATYRLLSGSKRYKIETDKKQYFVGESAVIRVTALDADYSPLKAERLDGLQVEDPDGRPLLRAGDAPVLDREAAPGTYRIEVRLPRSGDYRIYVEPPTREGGDRAEERIQVKFATREAQDTVPDHESLRALVKATHPQGSAPPLVPLWDLPRKLDELELHTTERVLDRKEIQLWDTPTTLILAAVLLAIEWVLRKRYQLI